MPRYVTSTLAALAASASFAAPALAGPLTVTTRVMVESRSTAADGTTRVALVAPTRVVPGDRVVFVLDYHNTGTQPIADLVLANPVPAGVAFRAPRPGTPAPDVSVDGRTFGSLGSLRVGARAATVDDVRQVRWRLTTPLAAGARGAFAFQGVLK